MTAVIAMATYCSNKLHKESDIMAHIEERSVL